MKPNVKTLLASLFIFLSFFSNAAHIIGGEMTYRCLGNGDYEINLVLYRDCFGGGAQFDGHFDFAGKNLRRGDKQQ